jgi:hypothetical protein
VKERKVTFLFCAEERRRESQQDRLTHSLTFFEDKKESLSSIPIDENNEDGSPSTQTFDTSKESSTAPDFAVLLADGVFDTSSLTVAGRIAVVCTE